MKHTKASITVELHLLTEAEGGKKSPIYLLSAEHLYRPHIVIGDRNQRKAVLRGNYIDEVYLGVQFRPCGKVLQPGDKVELTLDLMFYPDKAYDTVRPGAEFTMREGPQIVGHGRILTFNPKR